MKPDRQSETVTLIWWGIGLFVLIAYVEGAGSRIFAEWSQSNGITWAIVFGVLRALVVIGIIGSVTSARLNFLMELPGKYDSMDYAGPLEIVCAQGSVALRGDDLVVHIHIQLSGQDMCRGGHLAGATVFSTAEVTIGELDYQLQRQADSYTGLNELRD